MSQLIFETKAEMRDYYRAQGLVEVGGDRLGLVPEGNINMIPANAAVEGVEIGRIVGNDRGQDGRRPPLKRATRTQWLVASCVYVFKKPVTLKKALRRALDVIQLSDSYLDFLAFRRRISPSLAHLSRNVFGVPAKLLEKIGHRRSTSSKG